MNFIKKIHELLRQKEQIVKKPHKHDANLQKNSTLHFQVGLLIALIFTNIMFEMYFETTPLPKRQLIAMIDEPYTPVPRVKRKVIVVKPSEPKQEVKRPSFHEPIIKDTEPLAVNPQPVFPDKPFVDRNPPAPEPTVPVEETGPVSIIGVEEVPIFPGCEDAIGNSERIKCMSNKLSRIVQRKFDGDLAVEAGLEGRQRISVVFTIDKLGHITDIRARAPHPSLEREAKRVMTKVPKMTPGKQNKKEVDVIYALPIIFQVQN